MSENNSSYPTIRFCPACARRLEELDCTTYHCEACKSQFQIEYDSSPTSVTDDSEVNE